MAKAISGTCLPWTLRCIMSPLDHAVMPLYKLSSWTVWYSVFIHQWLSTPPHKALTNRLPLSLHIKVGMPCQQKSSTILFTTFLLAAEQGGSNSRNFVNLSITTTGRRTNDIHTRLLHSTPFGLAWLGMVAHCLSISPMGFCQWHLVHWQT